MSVTSHLKDLLTKMGGTPKNGDSTSVLIDKIEDVYDSGSGGEGSGDNSGAMVVSIYLDSVEDLDNSRIVGYFKMNKTYQQILNAYKNDTAIEFRYISVPTNLAGNEDFTPSPAMRIFIPTTDNSSLLSQNGHTVFNNNRHVVISSNYYEYLRPGGELGSAHTYESCQPVTTITFTTNNEDDPLTICAILINLTNEFICEGLGGYPVCEEVFEFSSGEV